MDRKQSRSLKRKIAVIVEWRPWVALQAVWCFHFNVKWVFLFHCISTVLYLNSKCCFQCKKKHKYVKYNIWGEQRFRGMSLSQCSWVLCCVTAGKTQGHHSVLNSFSCLMVCLTWAAHLTVSQNRNSKVDIIIYHKKKKTRMTFTFALIQVSIALEWYQLLCIISGETVIIFIDMC